MAGSETEVGGMDIAPTLSILVASDLHGSARGLAWFCDQAVAHKPEIIALLGDYVTFEPLHFTREVLRSVRGLAPHVLCLPGNCDPRETLVELDVAAFDGLHNLHKCVAEIGGLRFAGLGTSIHTPQRATPMEAPDESFSGALCGLLPADVWVLHNPLYGFLDEPAPGTHVGSLSLRQLWEDTLQKPKLVLSGHIHEAAGQLTHSGTLFVNPGPLSSSQAALVSLSGGTIVAQLLGR